MKDKVKNFRFNPKSLDNLILSSRLAAPMVLATVCGLLTGAFIILFVKMIDAGQWFFMVRGKELLSGTGRFWIVLIPVIGAFLVTVLARLLPETKGHGVPEVLKAIAIKSGKMPAALIFLKPLSSAISVGSGASVGREGPAVQVGAVTGSVLGRLLRLSEPRVLNMIACGSAAAIAAAFNAPITGVMFALEIILRDFAATTFSTVVVAAVASSVLSRAFLGESFAFNMADFSLRNPWEMFLFLILGVLSSLVAYLFIRIFDRVESVMEHKIPGIWVRALLGGLIIGLTALWFPQILGMGFEVIEQAFRNDLGLHLVLMLVFLKIFATSVSIASGASGGTFGPALFIGAMLGCAFGKMVVPHMPFGTAGIGAYVLVGMASVFSGAFHAPLTGIFLVFELTGDYRMILPIMIASVVSASLSKIMHSDSLDTIKLSRDGIDVEKFNDVRHLSVLRASDAMSNQFELVPEKMDVFELADRMAKAPEKVFFTVNSRGELREMVMKEDVQEVILDTAVKGILAADVSVPLRDYCLSDEPLSSAARLMLERRCTVLPVVNSEDNLRLEGILRTENIFKIYADVSSKRGEAISRAESSRFESESITSMVFQITRASQMDGKMVFELKLPEGVILLSVHRGGRRFVPKGKTVVHLRDRITAVMGRAEHKAFHGWAHDNHLTVSENNPQS